MDNLLSLSRVFDSQYHFDRARCQTVYRSFSGMVDIRRRQEFIDIDVVLKVYVCITHRAFRC